MCSTTNLDRLHVKRPVAEDISAYVKIGDASSVLPSRQLFIQRRRARRKCKHSRLQARTNSHVVGPLTQAAQASQIGRPIGL